MELASITSWLGSMEWSQILTAGVVGAFIPKVVALLKSKARVKQIAQGITQIADHLEDIGKDIEGMTDNATVERIHAVLTEVEKVTKELNQKIQEA